MSEPHRPVAFDAEHAERYDRQFEGLGAFRDALNLTIHLALEDAPPAARVLVVGAGTGQELLALAEQQPDWRFLALDPSAPMLEVCRRKIDAAGLEGRVHLHVGELRTLDRDQSFDAATSILVSQFILERAARVDFFRQIARRLAPGATLVFADLTCPSEAEPKARLQRFWARALVRAGLPPERTEAFLDSYERDVAVRTPDEVVSIVQEAGFEPPTALFQTGMIRGWSARTLTAAGG